MRFAYVVATAALTLPAAALSAAGDGKAPGTRFRDCRDCPEMVVVPAGSITIGSTPQERERFKVPDRFAAREDRMEVHIAKTFAVGRFEITRAQYARYVADAKPPFASGCAGYDVRTNSWPYQSQLNWRNPGFAQKGDEPVVCLNWPDAKAYVAWLSKKTGKTYRLLSETEWEYAARGGATTAYPWGDLPDGICGKANVYDRPTALRLNDREGLGEDLCANPARRIFTEPVGNYAPNDFGLYDMIGNAWELLEDCASDSYAGNPGDGSPVEKSGCTMRMPRGGGWNSRPWTARLSTRGVGAAEYRAVALGMRVARDLD